MTCLAIYIVVFVVFGIYAFIQTRRIDNHFDKQNAELCEKEFENPVVVGFVRIVGDKILHDVSDPSNKNVAILVDSGATPAFLSWKFAISKHRVYRMSLIDSDMILHYHKRTKWHDKVFSPVIKNFVEHQCLRGI